MGRHFDTREPLDWYKVPLLAVTIEMEEDGSGPTSYEPDNGSGSPLSGVSYVVRARDIGGSETLIGVPKGTSPGANWTAQTVGQATSHFATVMGRAAVAGEIQ